MKAVRFFEPGDPGVHLLRNENLLQADDVGVDGLNIRDLAAVYLLRGIVKPTVGHVNVVLQKLEHLVRWLRLVLRTASCLYAAAGTSAVALPKHYNPPNAM
jgi:hypothetical protein